jgi:ubiquinone/menaquinone biosynthesis C-methylase UbiE
MSIDNFHLKDDIRDYWSKRSETFDLVFGHRIPPGPEFDAWQQPVRDALGEHPLSVLELACGTGEVTRLIHDIGHDVTALDFSEAMLSVARRKHVGKPRLRFVLADAENTMEPDEAYDAIVCRHLVWTLTQPEQAFQEWHRVLKSGGRLLVFDGDWAQLTLVGRIASKLIALLGRFSPPDPHYDNTQSAKHKHIMEQLPFGDGLRPERIIPLLKDAGFSDIRLHSHDPIAVAQRKQANLHDRLRTRLYRRFILTATKP